MLMILLKMMQYEGRIKIDEEELRTVPHDLFRERITTISQEFVILPGTVRFNLSPYTNSRADPISDETMITLLKDVGLWSHFQQRGGLDAPLSDIKLSEGQRQLVNIARGMAHHIQTKSKIALMDEVTSQLDQQSDQQVQNALRHTFKDCTTLIIAHRIETLRDMDLILDISDGGVTVVSDVVRYFETIRVLN